MAPFSKELNPFFIPENFRLPPYFHLYQIRSAKLKVWQKMQDLKLPVRDSGLVIFSSDPVQKKPDFSKKIRFFEYPKTISCVFITLRRRVNGTAAN